MANIPTNNKPKWIFKPPAYKNANEGFYNSKAWRGLRAAYIRTYPLCKKCKDEGKTKKADHVDHIVPISQGGERLDWLNLQSLCIKCHNSKTASERRGNDSEQAEGIGKG